MALEVVGSNPLLNSLPVSSSPSLSLFSTTNENPNAYSQGLLTDTGFVNLGYTATPDSGGYKTAGWTDYLPSMPSFGGIFGGLSDPNSAISTKIGDVFNRSGLFIIGIVLLILAGLLLARKEIIKQVANS